jgi:uncharacterized protein
MHYLLFYEKAVDYKTRQATWQDQHRDHVMTAIHSGDVLLAGSLSDPDDGSAILLFKCDDKTIPEAFAAADPYVINGIVSDWLVRRWDVLPT